MGAGEGEEGMLTGFHESCCTSYDSTGHGLEETGSEGKGRGDVMEFERDQKSSRKVVV